MRGLAVVVASLVVAGTALPAAAQTGNATAAELRRQGLELYGKGDYQTAADRFEASFELDPRNDVLFAWAQSERLGGDCARAAELYEQFIASDPRPKQRKVAVALLALCREQVAGDSPDEPPDTSRSERAPAPPTADSRSPGGSWKRDWIGHGLAGGGAVAIGVGIGFIVKSSSLVDDARDAPSYPEYGSRLDRAELYRTLGIAGCAVGGALVATAIVHYLRFAPAEPDTAVTATVTAGEIGFAISGTF